MNDKHPAFYAKKGRESIPKNPVGATKTC